MIIDSCLAYSSGPEYGEYRIQCNFKGRGQLWLILFSQLQRQSDSDPSSTSVLMYIWIISQGSRATWGDHKDFSSSEQVGNIWWESKLKWIRNDNRHHFLRDHGRTWADDCTLRKMNQKKKDESSLKRSLDTCLRMVTRHMESPVYWIWLMFPMRLTEPYKAPWSLAIY